MYDKLGLRDYLNYSISGLLWLFIVLYFLLSIKMLKLDDLQSLNKLENSAIYVTLILLVGTYLIGNLLRFSELLLKFLLGLFWGNPHYWALKTDKNRRKDSSWKKNGALSKFKKFRQKQLSIGLQYSGKIEPNLKKLNIFNKKKENQFIMAETYLLLNYNSLKFMRLRDLKNFYESISLPFFIICFIINYEFFKIYDISLIQNISITCLITLIITYKFVDRYRFLLSNYIKDVYRYFLFLPKEK